MKAERTPEEKAQSRAIHSGFQVAGGAAFIACALAGALILSGRAGAPSWLFGGAAAAVPRGGDWSNQGSRVAFADWGPAPFSRARREGKLVLLFLGPEYSAAVARMEAGTFGDPEVAALVEARFVPVRVDSAEFPDLDRRYRARGWPTTALLTPDGDVVDAESSMTPAVFMRWAQAASGQAARPQELSRPSAQDLARTAAPPTPRQAEGRALQLLLSSWDGRRRTFDREGPRFPRFERVSALNELPAAWAQGLAAQAASGDWLFLDPSDGGARRSAGPDGGILAREQTATEQAAALDAFCPLEPAAARRVLEFVAGPFSPKGAPPRYLGWQAGYALTKNFFTATDGTDFDAVARAGWRQTGAARLGDDAELARAVLDCRVAGRADKARASAVVSAAARTFMKGAHGADLRLLLDDALGVGDALLAAGRPADAERVRLWMETNLSTGTFYWDRRATGVLPPALDRLADPGLNARALGFLLRLAAALPPGAQRDAVRSRAAALLPWLSARADALDPAVWAVLVAAASR